MFPLIEGTEFADLVHDIKQHGLREPVTVFDGQVLDGRNRLRACVAAGVPYRTVEYVGGDPVAFVISANLRRRHMNPSQCSMVAAKLANMTVGRPKENARIQAITQADAADLMNVSRFSVQAARSVLDSGDQELIGKVERGEVAT
jgi:ParB-like chromosome segregation protein Spo0J